MNEPTKRNGRSGMPDAHPHLVYMGAAYGDKRCDHCEYWPSPGRCNNTVILARAKAGEGGLTPAMVVGDLVKVDANGCSDEFWPKADPWEGDHDESAEAEDR